MNQPLSAYDGFEPHFGETSESMDAVNDESVQTVITSPPYWDLKDYGHDDQIGQADQDYEQYLDRLATVWQECYDALRPDGSMWIVVDSVMDRGDLKLIPYDIAQRCEEIGFELQDVIVWYKPTSIAGMTDRNVVNKKEYIIYLAKESAPKFRSIVDTEHGEEDPANGKHEQLGNLWRQPVKRGTAGQNVLHKAPYPVGLIDRIVRLATDPGDTVLDPFLGSGTTAYSALRHGRRCIGYEINPEFKSAVADRLANLTQQKLTDYADQ